MNYYRVAISPLLYLLAFFCIATYTPLAADSTAGPESNIPKILIVHSYERGQICGQPQDDGIIEALEEHGFKAPQTVEIKRFYMQTKAVYTTFEAIRERGRLARQLISDYDPDLVITLDDNAAHEVMLPLAGTTLPVVFSGINLSPERYNQIKHIMDSRQHPGGNITGVYEKLYISKTLNLISLIIPGKKVSIILDDTRTGQVVRWQIQDELKREPSEVAIDLHTVRTLQEFEAILRQGNKDPQTGAFYPVVTRLFTKTNQVLQAYEIIRWSLPRVAKPMFSLNTRFVQAGIFGGVAIDFRTMGRQAGKKAVAILRGSAPGSIPIEDATEIGLSFNMKRAHDLGITIPAELLGAAAYLYGLNE